LNSYQDHDLARFVEQPKSQMAKRNEFARDRARLLHSAALRRLSSKTQVLSPNSGDFARTRLTHSLEVAQIGRELATEIGVDPDLVDTACLAHDLGHPPFGHNGEAALNSWAEDIGGFEGNAQTFRVLTRLEPKIIDAGGHSRGLNLTRASLDASTKYPWRRDEASEFGNREKFGVYEDDLEVFHWMRQDAPSGVKCVEAQIMDFADDVAYSVHDFEDAIVEGYIDPAVLGDRAAEEALVAQIGQWAGGMLAEVQLTEALHRLRENQHWVGHFDGSPASKAALKNLTSDLIGRFVVKTTQATLENAPRANLSRYQSGVIVPARIRAEIAVLKGLVAAFLMTTSERKPFYDAQRDQLVDICNYLMDAPEALQELAPQPFWADDYVQRKRAVVDAVSSLTDLSAIALHRKLLEA
jgi:dGTPase